MYIFVIHHAFCTPKVRSWWCFTNLKTMSGFVYVKFFLVKIFSIERKYYVHRCRRHRKLSRWQVLTQFLSSFLWLLWTQIDRQSNYNNPLLCLLGSADRIASQTISWHTVTSPVTWHNQHIKTISLMKRKKGLLKRFEPWTNLSKK